MTVSKFWLNILDYVSQGSNILRVGQMAVSGALLTLAVEQQLPRDLYPCGLVAVGIPLLRVSLESSVKQLETETRMCNRGHR